MTIEIELKAWVQDPLELKKNLSSLAIFKGSFEKNDVYYNLEDPRLISDSSGYGVRVRKVTSGFKGISKEANLVTYKSKEVRDGIEVNNEKEFEVPSASLFEEFLMALGLKERIRKKKKGFCFDYNGITAELTEVEGLGWFIELEMLLSAKDNEKIENGRARLLDFLDQLEIPRESIESRSYSTMLSPRGGAEAH